MSQSWAVSKTRGTTDTAHLLVLPRLLSAEVSDPVVLNANSDTLAYARRHLERALRARPNSVTGDMIVPLDHVQQVRVLLPVRRPGTLEVVRHQARHGEPMGKGRSY